ncbi:NAD-dependent epimerase/dehydratase family protein [Solibacillus sp. FSL H8-0523]|uniref:NAD-dependent epimerase/dehydratase family protein n=1 Tax=Solibacillus sp. FSL H8-0523 TaxID=2954511 RepID=UPI0031010187
MLLVTGITGHTGQYFLKELIANDYIGKIRCLVRETTNIAKLENTSLDIEVLKGDLNDKNFLVKAIEGVTEIVHIYNIHHSRSIIDVALKKNVSKVVLVHTTGIYSKFKEASAGYKQIEADIQETLHIANHPMNVVILRPSMIYGDLCDHNMSKFIKLVDKVKFVPIIDNGNSLIQPVNARDLGKAYYTALTKINKSTDYDLTGDRPITLKEALESIALNLNKKIHFISVPLSLGLIGARVVKTLSLSKIDLIEKVQRMAENRSYSHEKAKQDFAYKPMTFEQGILEEIRQYKVKKSGESL